MHQALHIFKKDVRYLRIEIALVLILVFAFTPIWPVAVVYLIARLIHAEAIPGDNQFWLTRPYSRTSLITAKFLFILTFVNFPFFLVQTYQFMKWGFGWQTNWPGLLWSQVLMFLCLSLPVAALAAVTPGLVAFMFIQLILVVVGAVLGQARMFGLDPSRPSWPTGVEWMSNALIVLIFTIATVIILAVQYYQRKTLVSAATGAAAIALGLSVVFLLPPKTALIAEINFTKPTVDIRSIGLAQSPLPAIFNPPPGPRDRGTLTVPLQLAGLPPDADMRVDAIAADFHSQGGTTLTLFNDGADVYDVGSGVFRIKPAFRIAREFVQAEKNRPVILDATVYATLFGDPKSQTIPQQPEPVTVLDRFRCSTAELEHLVEHRCMSWFRWPGEMIYAQTTEKDPIPFYRSISYSPFPAELNLVPVELHTALNSQGLAPPSPFGPPAKLPVTIVAKRPTAHIRRDIELRGIVFSQLGDGIHILPPPPRPPKAPK